MIKRFLPVIMVLTTIFLLGCGEASTGTKPSSPKTPEIVRSANLAPKWKIRQMKFDLGTGQEMSIALKLGDGDKVDGYFYLEKGSNVDFRISGNSLVYRPQFDVTSAGGISSDKFAFVANYAQQGTTYVLLFRNVAGVEGAQKVTIFLEIIYPITGSIFAPME